MKHHAVTPWAIDSSVLRDLEAHARADSPRECCGALIGAAGHVLASRRAANLAEGNNRFLVDPQAQVAAMREARRRSLEVVGFYHSHPHTPAVPSPTDLAEAYAPEVLHVIVGLAGPAAEVRAYHLHGDHYEEVPLHAVAASDAAIGPSEMD